jgi:long-chain acyl-CoA synthetase
MIETVPELFARAVRENPHGLALVAGGVRLTWASMGGRWRRSRQGWRVRAVGWWRSCCGTRLRWRWRSAAQRAGAAACALNPDYTAAELARCWPMRLRGRAVRRGAGGDRGWLALGAELIAVGDDAAFVAELLAANATPYTRRQGRRSGGDPVHRRHDGAAKGVELTHRAVAVNVQQREARLPTLWGDERVVAAMPLFHSFGQPCA